jgi:hypothetical protein
MANCSFDQINTVSLNILDDFTFFSSLLVIVLVQAAYAGAHLGALSIIFPSQKERILWKISCYILFAVTSLSAILFFILTISERVKNCSSKYLDVLAVGIFVIIIPVFLWARAYIVVESFISLRHVPVGVYQTPQGNIMDYVPHL